jgi:cytochrome c
MASTFKHASLVLLAAGFAAGTAHAVLTWPNCKDVANTDFKAVPLVTRAANVAAEPMKMAFDLLAAKTEDAKGKVDVYFTERLGNVRKFDSKTSTVITLGKIPLNIDAVNSSDGVLGIALDPAFKTNHNVFIYYTYVSASEKNWRVSRFTLNAANDKLDPTTEIPVIKIAINSGSKHPGGALQFDSYGDLWITTGNDYKVGNDFPTYSSANTNDLRGKILRIHPTADGKYTVPAGNLFPAGTANTRPEIYIMGDRNPYTLALDPVRRWIVWGEVGPDNVDMDGKAMNSGGAEKTEEYNLAKAPGFYGYPFFSGDYATKSGINAAAPVIPDTWDWGPSGAGLKTLPAAQTAIYSYKKACAITGPIFRYDGDLNSTIKFPPHFTRKWLVSDFNGDANKMKLFTLDADATKIVSEEQVISTIPLHGPLDIQQGPDGALYVNNYDGYRTSGTNTGLIRIEYTGDCHPAEPKLETTTTVGAPWADRSPLSGPRVEILPGAGFSVSVATSGEFTLQVRDLMGRPLASRTAKGPAPVSLEEVKQAGVYLLQVTSAEGVKSMKVIRN